MPETVADPLSPPCLHLLSRSGIQESQSLDPDLSPPRARDARGRFAKGSSGNLRGRPRGIRNTRRRLPDLVARPLSAKALSDLLDRKPVCCGPSPCNSCRRRSLPSIRPSVSGSTCRYCARPRIFGSYCPPFWQPSRVARSRPPRARASLGVCVPGCAPSGASPGLRAGDRVRDLRPACRSRRIPRPVPVIEHTRQPRCG
jgi:hypothetical protein